MNCRRKTNDASSITNWYINLFSLLSVFIILLHLLESSLRKLRCKDYPPLPNDQKFVIPTVYQRTYANRKFLIYDKRRTAYSGRLLIFLSDEQKQVLFHSDVLFADGIFKVLPKLFQQLYVIHGFQDGEGMCFFQYVFMLHLYISI